MAHIVEAAKNAIGMGGPKVRYAVVALGDISQRAFMPGVHHTFNSELVAVVTGDPEKAKDLCKQYGIKDSYSYEQFDDMIKSKKVDAIYLATPNWRHAEFAIPALKAGIHVLLEKPMEVTIQKCNDILNAQKNSKNNAKLMVAYRLHFEPATIAAIDKVRSGDLGEVHMFSAMFTQMCKPENYRGHSGEDGGPLFDIGIYPLNAARNLFGSEPIEVSAFGTKHPDAGFSGDFYDTVSATLRFPNNRLAQFTVSYYGNSLDEYTIAGTKGSIRLSPSFMYTKPLEFAPIIEGENIKDQKFKQTDHFGGELKYFSDCILNGTDPEPDGEEGLCDVRVIEALLKSLASNGAPQKLEPYTRKNRITRDQVVNLNPVKLPDPKDETNCSPPVQGQ